MKLDATAVRKLQSYFHYKDTQHKFSECGIALYDAAMWFIKLLRDYDIADYTIDEQTEKHCVHFDWFDSNFIIEVSHKFIVIWYSYTDDERIFCHNDSLFSIDEVDDTFMRELSEYLRYRKHKNEKYNQL